MQDQFKLYQRKATWINLRPYQLGEDLSGISVSHTDIPETDMGYIAQNPENPQDMWYIAKAFAESNYNLCEQNCIDDEMEHPTPPSKTVVERLQEEHDDLNTKIQRLISAINPESPIYPSMSETQLELLTSQLSAMSTYLNILEARIQDLK